MDTSNANKAFLYQKWKYFSTLDASNSEYNKLKQWIDYAMAVPTKMIPMQIAQTDTSYKINKYLWVVKNMLDREIFGLNAVKEKILFLLNNRITNNKSKGMSFALCGPPGTAKTSIIKCLSKAISLPFFQINIGGAKDSSTENTPEFPDLIINYFFIVFGKISL
jgi:ATP-dependent Lon protease